MLESAAYFVITMNRAVCSQFLTCPFAASRSLRNGVCDSLLRATKGPGEVLQVCLSPCVVCGLRNSTMYSLEGNAQ